MDATEAATYIYVPAPVDTDIKPGDSGWGIFTTHIEKICEFFEKCIWPVDPEADIMPHCLMPFEYASPTGEECEETLKCLLGMLTVGLQGQAFAWKYKFDFDVVFSTERKAYLVLLNSVRRMWNRDANTSETTSVTTSETGAGAGSAGGAIPATTNPADFTPPTEKTE